MMEMAINYLPHLDMTGIQSFNEICWLHDHLIMSPADHLTMLIHQVYALSLGIPCAAPS